MILSTDMNNEFLLDDHDMREVFAEAMAQDGRTIAGIESDSGLVHPSLMTRPAAAKRPALRPSVPKMLIALMEMGYTITISKEQS